MQISRKRRFLIGVCASVVWMGFLVQGTHALFVDTAVLSANTITTGSIDLQVSNSQNGSSTLFADNRTGFSYTLSPGMSDEKYFFLKNVTTDAPNLDIDFIAVSLNGPPTSMFGYVTLEFTPVDADGNSTGTAVTTTLGSVMNTHFPLGSTIAAGKAQRYKLKTMLQNGYGSQGQSISYDLVFTGTQKI